MLPSWIVLDGLLADWIREDIGRGNQTTLGLGNIATRQGRAYWVAKEDGVIAGLPVAGAFSIYWNRRFCFVRK